MKEFEYVHPKSLTQAAALLAERPDSSKPIAGGVDLIGEMKDYLATPSRVVNLKSIPGLDEIRESPNGLRLGPLALLATLEKHTKLTGAYAAIAQAAASVGSVQIRNQGTLGGNLCQRPRCWYYRSPVHPCLKKGGSVCFSVSGENKFNAILGGGPSYIVHPSDLAPALIALDATVSIIDSRGKVRTIPLEEFYTLPEVDVTRETVLKPGELVSEINVPKASGKSAYLKFKEKETMDFALSAAAVSLTIDGGVCKKARVVLGGVAPIPWRARAAEAALVGKRIDARVAQAAAEAATEGAQPLSGNGFKIPLTHTLVRRAILSLIG